jgi:3-hydroxypropanoate dehydrogenase
MAGKVSDAALDTLFGEARSFGAFRPDAVSDDDLRAIYEIAKFAPSTANSQPLRVVFVRSEEAKQRLVPALSSINREKTLAAPLVAIFAYDLKFYEFLPRLYWNPAATSWYTRSPQQTEETAFRNATIQASFFMMAVRARGFDCGPMSGFDNAKLDAEFFPDGRFKSNFLCLIGKGDRAKLPVANPRFEFDEVCRIV